MDCYVFNSTAVRFLSSMSDSQQEKHDANKKEPPFIQSMILIILETFITFVLKHDRMARTYAKPFIKQHISIQFNTFLPSDLFFVTFTSKGVLFDHFEPQHPKPTLNIYASSIDLIRILLTGSEGSIHRVQIIGEDHLHEEFRMFLRSISLPALFSDWRNWINNAEAQSAEAKFPQRSIEPLLKRIETQQTTINQLNLTVKELNYDLKDLQRKHKLTSRLYIFIIFILCISTGLILWYN